MNDIVHAEILINHTPNTTSVIADKGYDRKPLREAIEVQGRTANIPRRNNSKIGNADMDWCLYRYRNLVENAFMKIKKYRAVATRYDKLARNYRSVMSLAFYDDVVADTLRLKYKQRSTHSRTSIAVSKR